MYGHVVPLATTMKHLYIMDGTGYTIYVYIYFLLYLLCDSAPSHGVQINLTVSLRTHSAQSAASSSGNAEQFPHSDICYLLICVHAVFLYIRRVAM